MRAAVYTQQGTIELGVRPDPGVHAPTDAVVRVVLACVCGSDLTYYRGERSHAVGSIGHESIGVVEDVGADVKFAPGQLVIVPLQYACGTCAHCRAGVPFACEAGATFGNGSTDGGQGEAVRVPFADATLVPVPGAGHPDELLRSLLTLSDVMCAGHHAAVSADVRPGAVVSVVGDGAVGLCGVLAASRLGAERIIVLSRNPARQAVARAFGATDVVTARGEEAVATILDLTRGIGVDASLECVGTPDAVATAFGVARPGSMVGMVGISDDPGVPVMPAFWRNVGWRGGPTQAPAYIPELLPDVLEGRINPGLVLDWVAPLDGLEEAYRAMDERRAIKSLLRVSTP